MRSSGGVASLEEAAAHPAVALLSGPAAGTVGAALLARRAGFENAISFDMGGTSTDVSLIVGGRASLTAEREVGGLPLRLPAVDLHTVGAGGGSIVWLDSGGAVRVGPESAGADPGPACYGRGGTRPTVTDANLLLGRLPAVLAGGIELDADAAARAFDRIDPADALEVVNAEMLRALRVVSVERGHDPREFALVAFGGAGPLHANALGRLTGAWPVIIPPSPGVLCAYGDATTSLRDEAARTYIRRFSELTDDELRAIFEDLAETAAATVEAEGVARAEQTVTYQVDIRYHGQGFEISVPASLADFDGEGGGLKALGAAFDAEHQRLFSFLLRNEHELVSVRATVSGPRPHVQATRLPDGGTDPAAAARTTTTVHVDGAPTEATVYDRAKLVAGNVVTGPAIVTEMDSTTLVLPGHAATVHPSGCLLIRPLEAGA